MKKRVISLMLVLVMMISAMVVPASAATISEKIMTACGTAKANQQTPMTPMAAFLGVLNKAVKSESMQVMNQQTVTDKNAPVNILDVIVDLGNNTSGKLQYSLYGDMASMYRDVMGSYRVMNNYLKYLYPVSDDDLNRNGGSYTAAVLDGLLGDLLGMIY